MTDARLGAAMDVRFGVTVSAFAEYLASLGLEHLELKREYLAGHPEAPGPERIADIADAHDLTVSYHAPFRDWNTGSFDAAVRDDSVSRAKRTIDDAATAGAEAVVVHGGSVPERYPDWVREQSEENAKRSLAEIAEYADLVGVPLCLENQPPASGTQRYTTHPSDLAAMLEDVDVPPETLGVTLDVGHAALTETDWQAFVDRFSDRIRVCHLHENDGTADQHEPIPDHEHFLDAIPADLFVFEMKSVDDVAASVSTTAPAPDPVVTSDD